AVVMLFVFIFFFFSSRRRHTRWPRDWSSDVCSSDLFVRLPTSENFLRIVVKNQRKQFGESSAISSLRAKNRRGVAAPGIDFGSRSEERRVGKECRAGWGEYH